MPTKNLAFLLTFPLYDSSTGALKSGSSPVATISKNGGSFVASTNSVSEVSGGRYKILLYSAEMDADTIVVAVTAADALAVTIEIETSLSDVAETARAVWDEEGSEHIQSGSFGRRLDMPVSKVGR